MNRTLLGTLLAGLLLATPLAAASTVTVTAREQPIGCVIGIFPQTVSTPWLNPYARATIHRDCTVDATVIYHTPVTGQCPAIGPFPWLRPYVAVENDCDVLVLA